MLRCGLTGGLGSGKSTVARMLAGSGAHIISADEIGRSLMQPGETLFGAIVRRFGSAVVHADGRLDRRALSQIAFASDRIEELNAIVHPVVIERQAEMASEIEARDPHGIVVVESALIFETRYGGEEGWRTRFDRLILVTAPEELRVRRFVERSSEGRTLTPAERDSLEAEALQRMAQQIPDERKSPICDYMLTNDGAMSELEWQVDRLWGLLRALQPA